MPWMVILRLIFLYRTTQVSELRSTLSDARERRQEEDAAAATKLRVIAGRADELKTALLEARAEIQEKDRQLTRHKEEVCVSSGPSARPSFFGSPGPVKCTDRTSKDVLILSCPKLPNQRDDFAIDSSGMCEPRATRANI